MGDFNIIYKILAALRASMDNEYTRIDESI